MTGVEQFVAICRFAGDRFDLVQGSGGNASAKLADGSMLIKSSGGSLSEVVPGRGYVRVDNRKILSILEDPPAGRRKDKAWRNALAGDLASRTVVEGSGRPSIEVFLHALLARYTLHVHPVAVNAIACRRDWKRALRRIFGSEPLLVEYRTPGIELALRMRNELEKRAREGSVAPEVVFLQNHGLIVTSDRHGRIESLAEEVVRKAGRNSHANMSRYGLVSRVSSWVSEATGIRPTVVLSDDFVLRRLARRRPELFSIRPACPDTRVFCGVGAVEIGARGDKGPIAKYFKDHREAPRVILYRGEVFLVADTVRKAKETEEVLKAAVLALSGIPPASVRPLPRKELRFLGGWEAEKYRQRR